MQELVIDSFAGGGGASLGIAAALGRGPDVAINHDAAAIAMHAANHPDTRHYPEDVWKVAPRKVTRGRPVGLLWASPDCRDFSRAKGARPVKKNIRSLAWVVVKWAVEAAPRVIVLENVREFEEWGPLVPRWACAACDWKGTEGQAKLARRGRRACPRCDSLRLKQTADMVRDPARLGLTFKRFVGRLRNLGYHVERRVLNAADYGAPTHRRRLFLVARNDGEPVVWPEPTHADPKKLGADLFGAALKPWRTAAECIDWSLPCPSIFLTREQGRKLGVNRPLAEKTMRRIALGIKRYVLENPRPFIVRYNSETSANDHRSHGLDDPLPTVVTQNRFGVVTPVIVPVTHAGERRAHPVGEPLPTVTGANRGEHALVAPVIVPCRTHGGGGNGASSVENPLRTVTCTKRGEFAVVAPIIARIGQTGGNGKYCNPVTDPVTTITSKAEHLLIAPTLVQTGYGEREGQAPRALDIEAPLGTVVAGGQKHAVVAAFLAKHYGGQVGQRADAPQPTTCRGTQTQLVAANLVHLNRGDKTSTGCDEPGRTVVAGGNHAALVYSFLMKYYGTGGQWQAPADPMHTATAKGRLGLVTVTVDGQEYAIVDVGMRMLSPRELARAQGFPDGYVMTGTKTSQVERIGNSVPPALAQAIVAANYAPRGAGVPA